MHDLHPQLHAIFAAFNQAGVRWCVLRDEALLAAPIGDVDLLVAPADMGRVRKILTARQYLPIASSNRGTRCEFVGYHAPSETWIALDVVTELAYGRYHGLRAGAAAEYLARCQHVRELRLLAPGDAFWAVLLRCMLDKGAFAPRHTVRLRALVDAAHTDTPLAQQVASACPSGWSRARLLEYVTRGEWSELVRVAPALAAGWRHRHPFASRWRAAVNRTSRLPETALLRLRQRGMSVALLGPDGAGKSTLAANIMLSYYFPVRSVYMGLWQRGTPYSGSGAHPHPRGTGVAGRVLEIAARLPKAWGRYLLAQYHMTLGRIVIFDRYMYDALLPGRQSVSAPKWLYLWLLGHACPAPDMAIVLDVPGEMMYARKGEDTPENLEAQRQRLLALSALLPRVQVVDAAREESIVHADVAERIWTEYCSRRGKGQTRETKSRSRPIIEEGLPTAHTSPVAHAVHR